MFLVVVVFGVSELFEDSCEAFFSFRTALFRLPRLDWLELIPSSASVDDGY